MSKGVISDFFLLEDNGEGVRISSGMVELGERFEVGRARIERMTSRYLPTSIAVLPTFLHVFTKVERLTKVTAVGRVDSGLRLSTSNGKSLSVSAGLFPYSIAFEATDALPFDGACRPEYPIDSYQAASVVRSDLGPA